MTANPLISEGMLIMNDARFLVISSLIVNFVIFAVTVFSVAWCFTKKGRENADVAGVKAFKFFTVDSNILAGLASLLAVVFQIRNVCSGRFVTSGALPEWLRSLKFVSVVSVMLTFLTVMAFLGPRMGYGKMFEGVSLFMHLTTPLMAFLSFLFLECGKRTEPLLFILGIVPMLIYGTVYIIMVLVTKKWQDFYQFNVGGLWWVSVTAMIVATAAIAFGTGFLANLISGSRV